MRLHLTLCKNKAIWVIMEQLIKTVHFISVRMDFSLAKLTKLNIREMVRLHEVNSIIVLCRDP